MKPRLLFLLGLLQSLGPKWISQLYLLLSPVKPISWNRNFSMALLTLYKILPWPAWNKIRAGTWFTPNAASFPPSLRRTITIKHVWCINSICQDDRQVRGFPNFCPSLCPPDRTLCTILEAWLMPQPSRETPFDFCLPFSFLNIFLLGLLWGTSSSSIFKISISQNCLLQSTAQFRR